VPAPVAEAPHEERSIGTVTVTASELNVRSTASTSADVITKARRGTKLTLLVDEKEWMKVRLGSGEVGWVAAQHVSREGEKPRKRGGCPADSDYSFVKTPTPAFSDRQEKHGLVVVDAYVDTKGNVTATKVVTNTTGDETLAFLTQREIKGAKFVAPVRNCVSRAFVFTYKRSF